MTEINFYYHINNMNFLFSISLLFLAWVQRLHGTALDDYVWAPDDNYGWVDMVILQILILQLSCLKIVYDCALYAGVEL